MIEVDFVVDSASRSVVEKFALMCAVTNLGSKASKLRIRASSKSSYELSVLLFVVEKIVVKRFVNSLFFDLIDFLEARS